MTAAWSVLVVDDDPDVLALSRLAMGRFRVFGLPLNLLMAAGRAEALAVVGPLLSSSGRGPPVAVALVDVVMDTETAGLDLCRRLHENSRHHATQIYIRTGQPGLAPELEVIRGHDITGYISKQEATEDRLFGLIRAGIRQYYLTDLASQLTLLLNRLVLVSNSRQSLRRRLSAFWAVKEVGAGDDTPRVRSHTFVDGCSLGGGLDEVDARKVQTRLAQRNAASSAPSGPVRLESSGREALIEVARGGVQLAHVSRADFDRPPSALALTTEFWSSFAQLWSQARG